MRWAKNANTRMNLVFGLFMIALPLLAFVAIWSHKHETVKCPITVSVDKTQKCVSLEVVDTEAARVRGLSGRSAMRVTEGMLFDFGTAGNHCIWMKDMKFSLDIVWLDADRKIIDIKKNVSPETYPKSFCPSKPALYVIELVAGVADKAGLGAGRVIEL